MDADEAAFLDRIRYAPDDDAIRLVYADWLQDRDDPRAEYLRLEHELFRIPLRLAELRTQLDPEWVKAVGKLYRIVLGDLNPNRRISLIKLVREVTKCGLADAKELSYARRPVILNGLSINEAERLVARFAFEAGAICVIEPDVPG